MKRTGLLLMFVLLIALLWIAITWEAWTQIPWRRHGHGAPPYGPGSETAHLLKGIGSLLGVLGFTTFSLSLFLASRWPKLERWLGGLDQIYRTHHRLGVIGFTLLLIHPLLLAARWIPLNLAKFALFLFPQHDRLSVNLGSVAFWLMVLILGITLLRLLPYDKWKWTHKGMSLVFFLAIFHILLSDRPFSPSGTKLLLALPMALGLWAILYKQLWTPLFRKGPPLTISAVNAHNPKVTEITFEGEKVPFFFPGQYAFFQFRSPSLSRETHPFTLCGDRNRFSIFVKARGDYTKKLASQIKQGDWAYLEGPFGTLDYRKQGPKQIWIGGGIGIVPFLAWCPLLDSDSPEIDLYYCLHSREEGIGLDLFSNTSKCRPRFRFHLICSTERPHLKADEVAPQPGVDILMCGPKQMTRDLRRQFQVLGIPRKKILFEDFEFFSPR